MESDNIFPGCEKEASFRFFSQMKRGSEMKKEKSWILAERDVERHRDRKLDQPSQQESLQGSGY